MAPQNAGNAQPPLRFHNLERPEVPRRRHRHRDLRQVRHDLGAADRLATDLQRPRGPGSGRDVAMARSARAAEGGQTTGG